MLRNGYSMIADAPGYYGDGIDNDRVVMLKRFDLENSLDHLSIDDDSLPNTLQGLTEPTAMDDKIASGADVIAILTKQSDEVDSVYNLTVSKLLRSGYAGVACNDLDVGDSDGGRESAMVFVRLATLGENAELSSQRQSELQTILDADRSDPTFEQQVTQAAERVITT
jgi:hypothetical protein